MKRLGALLIVLVMLAACGEKPQPVIPGASGSPSTDRSGSASTDYQGNWRLVSGHGPSGEIVLVNGADISLIMDGERASGRAACNSYNAELRISGSSLQVGGGGMTQMGCEPDVSRSQDSYMDALTAVDEIVRRGDTLILTGAETELIFETVPSPPTSELVNTTWALEGLLEGSAAQGTVTDAAPADLLLSEDGIFTGSTGCRDLSGEWSENGSEIHFTTMEARGNCPERFSDQDNLVVGVLGDGFSVEIEGDQLTVLDRSGAGLLYRSKTD